MGQGHSVSSKNSQMSQSVRYRTLVTSKANFFDFCLPPQAPKSTVLSSEIAWLEARLYDD